MRMVGRGMRALWFFWKLGMPLVDSSGLLPRSAWSWLIQLFRGRMPD
jgi:hypothetical protein